MNILAGTDLLPKSEAAIERAAFIADQLQAELAIVHAVSPAAADGHTLNERVAIARSRLADRTARPRWPWRATPDLAVQFGRPARVVLDHAHRRSTRLVVVGPHRTSTLPDAVSGTITERLLFAAICPLLIVRRQVRGAYREVLVALDDAPQAGEVVRAVESLQLTHERRATVIHAHEPPHAGMTHTVGMGREAALSYPESYSAQTRLRITDLLHRYSSDADRYEVVIADRRPVAAILGAIERLQPDLVVLGTGAHGRLRRALFGSVASDIARAATCDVLLVPDGASVAGRDHNQTARLRGGSTGHALTGRRLQASQHSR